MRYLSMDGLNALFQLTHRLDDATGSDDQPRFVEYLHKGPFGSRVADVSISWREPIQNYERFTINY